MFDSGRGIDSLCAELNSAGNVFAAIKEPCKAATTANITLRNRQTIDGVALLDGDRVLVKDQTAGLTNGIYLHNSNGQWPRAVDWADTAEVVEGTLVHVQQGTVSAGLDYRVTTSSPIVVGVTTVAIDVAFSAASTSFLQSGIGATALTVQGVLRSWVMPEMFGAAGDGVTDDTAAIQRAIDYFTGYAGEVYLPNGYLISGTLTITEKSVVLKGRGWGDSDGTIKVGFIKWNGVAGIPMVKLTDGFGAGVENLRFIGKSTAKPSAAIEIASVGSGTQFGSYFRRVWIGKLYGLDTDSANQFDNGIITTGTINGDTQTFEHIRITGCGTTGMDFRNPNSSDSRLDTVNIQTCAIGIKTKASLVGENVFIGDSGTTDIQLETAGKINFQDFVSEASARFCVFNGNGCKLLIRGGSWQTGINLAGDYRWIDTQNTSQWTISLEDFELTYGNSPSSPPLIRAYNTAGGTTSGYLRLKNTWNIYPNNLELGSMVWTNDARKVEYDPAQVTGQDPLPRQFVHFNYDLAADRSFEVFRNDFLGKFNLFGGPFNLRRFVAPVNVSATATGGSGTTYSYKVTALTRDGETDPSSAATCSGGATLSVTVYNTVAINPVQGAYAYKIYGRTAAGELLMKTLDWNTDLHPGKNDSVGPPSWRDDGSVTPSGALPTVNTTGNMVVEGKLSSSSPTSGIGYSTGAGGTQTQLTNKGTTVVLNKVTGQITMEATAALNADTTVSFTLTNSAIAAGDHVLVQHVSGGTVGSYACTAVAAAGSATVYVRNITPGNLTEAPVLKFSVIKAVTA